MATGEYPNGLVNDVVFRNPATIVFTRQDWIDLAMAALDQAGLSAVAQEKVAALTTGAAHVIVVTKRYADFHAELKGTKRWSAGKSHYEAIGDLVVHHSESFGIVIEMP